MHIDFVLPIDHSIKKGLDSYHEKAKKGCMDFGFHVAVTAWNDKVSKDMEAAVESGINSFKFYLAYKVRFPSLCTEAVICGIYFSDVHVIFSMHL